MNQNALVVAAIVVIIAILAIYVVESALGSKAPSTVSTSAPTTTVAPNATANETNMTHEMANATNNTRYYGAYTIGYTNDSTIGEYLTNASGFALYTYNADTQGSNTSSCTSSNGCIQAWPAFYTANLTLEQGLDSSMFGTIMRTDGKMQTTYNGLPLYLYRFDTRADEAAGDGVNGFVAAKV